MFPTSQWSGSCTGAGGSDWEEGVREIPYGHDDINEIMPSELLQRMRYLHAQKLSSATGVVFHQKRPSFMRILFKLLPELFDGGTHDFIGRILEEPVDGLRNSEHWMIPHQTSFRRKKTYSNLIDCSVFTQKGSLLAACERIWS